MKKTLLIALAACAAIFAHGQAQDDNWGSLYQQKTKNPYVDRTACQVGDIVTIVVSEASNASFSAATSATKKDTNAVDKMNIPFLSALKFNVLSQFMGGMSSGANSSVSGTGSTTQTGAMTAKIAVTVKEVLPNGNLVLEGTRMIKVNKDVQIYKLTGICRKDDVRFDNTVLSSNVAEAQITTDGKGLIGDRQRKGIITRIMDWLF